ncbi:MAG: DUF4019 domain-containing protein [Planctomycetota bacterium]|jgi:hypothetical protein
MKKTHVPVSAILIAATLILAGCKEEDEPAPEVNEPVIRQPEQIKQTASGPEGEKAAVAAAEAWLKIVDSEQYAKSWEESAEYFRNAVPKEQWAQLRGRLRMQLGKVVSRTLTSKNFTTTLQNAPEGKYVVIQYKTRFEKRSVAVETITPMLEKDGKWKVSGYYIK